MNRREEFLGSLLKSHNRDHRFLLILPFEHFPEKWTAFEIQEWSLIHHPIIKWAAEKVGYHTQTSISHPSNALTMTYTNMNRGWHLSIRDYQLLQEFILRWYD